MPSKSESREVVLRERMVECCDRLASLARNRAPIVILGAAAWSVVKILAAIDPGAAFKLIASQIGGEDRAARGFCASGESCMGDGTKVDRPMVYCNACMDEVAKDMNGAGDAL
jgi:hypothetical protein